MDDDLPAPWTLHGMWRELMDLHDGYPAEAPSGERADYFTAAIRRGLEAHQNAGSEAAGALDLIGLTAGVSGRQIKAWADDRRSVHPHFHQGALLAQAALMHDHIQACGSVLQKIHEHLEADDWRAELSAFDHLKSIGLTALADHGGAYGRWLAAKLQARQGSFPPIFVQELRRLALINIAAALEELIGAPDGDGHLAEDGADKLSAAGPSVN